MSLVVGVSAWMILRRISERVNRLSGWEGLVDDFHYQLCFVPWLTALYAFLFLFPFCCLFFFCLLTRWVAAECV